MNWLALGAFCCAASVAAGAFGAHGLASRLDERSLALWETAARYLMYGGFGTCLIGLAARVLERSLGAPGWLMLAGTLVFSLTVFALALGGPRWLGAVTPAGGLMMIAGFVALGLAAWRA